jgi:hypothetical protein
MTTIEILKKAHELLNDPTRWGQGADPRPGTSCIQIAIFDTRGPLAAQRTALAELGFASYQEARVWNDAPERTHAEVLQRFDAAVTRLETDARKTIWLCGACGRTGATRMTVGDESCYLHSVEVFVDSIERDANSRIKAAQAVTHVDNVKRKK